METLVETLLTWTDTLGYLGVFLLMTIESSFIPFPSEIVVPPAAYLAAQGQMNIYLVIAAGIGGSLLGATINYFLAYFLGRPLIYSIAKHRMMKYLLITHHKLKKAEEYFNKYGGIATFLGRLIPGIRQLISIPAGFSKMRFTSFVFYTFLGAGSWVVILAILGYIAGENQGLINQYLSQISIAFIAIAILVGVWIYVKIKRHLD